MMSHPAVRGSGDTGPDVIATCAARPTMFNAMEWLERERYIKWKEGKLYSRFVGNETELGRFQLRDPFAFLMTLMLIPSIGVPSDEPITRTYAVRKIHKKSQDYIILFGDGENIPIRCRDDNFFTCFGRKAIMNLLEPVFEKHGLIPVWYDPRFVEGEPEDGSEYDHHFSIFVPELFTDSVEEDPIWNHMTLDEISREHFPLVPVADHAGSSQLLPGNPPSIHVINAALSDEVNVRDKHWQLLGSEGDAKIGTR